MNLDIDLELIKKSRKKEFSTRDLVSFGLFRDPHEITSRRQTAKPVPPGIIGERNAYFFEKTKLIKWIEKQRKESLKPKDKTRSEILYKHYRSEDDEAAEFFFESPAHYYASIGDDYDEDQKLSIVSHMNAFRHKKDTRD